MLFDTIAGISTPAGYGGIGIVRISGSESLNIAQRIFKPKSNKKIKDLRNFSINYGHIYDGDNLIDEVMVSIMKAPNTYTKEDIVEINCHGGYITTQKILEIILKNGARLSENGEFTRRAFLNGRIDLTQAESVIDIIHAKTSNSVQISLGQLRGDLKTQIEILKKAILDVAAHINVVLDYPEEGIDDPLPSNLVENLKNVNNTITKLITSYDKGKMIKEGVRTAIVGKPNVGKSSLLNAILKEDRAIVTHIAGTTRDVIEEVINLKGIPLILVDTAGIRKTQNIVENIGVEKSKNMINRADLVLFVVDASLPITDEDIEIYEKIDKNKVIGIINKIDINGKVDISKFDKIKNWIEISAKNNQNIDDMEDKIYSFITENDTSSEKLLITNIRHKVALTKTKEYIDNMFETINLGLPMDLLAVDIKGALDSLGEITGEISSEDLLDHIFGNFCVGK